MAGDFDIRGFTELDKVLKSLPDNIHKRALTSGLRAGARVVIKDARSRLDSNYKLLKQSIGVKILRNNAGFTKTAIIGPRSTGKYKHIGKPYKGRLGIDAGSLGTIVEYGTLASRTEPLSPKTRRSRKYNKGLPTGLRPNPFLRPAIDNTKQEQLNAIGLAIKKYLDRFFG